MKKSAIVKVMAVAVLLATLLGCDQQPTVDTTNGPTQQTTPDSGTASSPQEVYEYGYIAAVADKQYTFPDDRPVFSLDNAFYDKPILVELKTAQEAEIYYTTDGSEPDENSERYEDGIYILPKASDFPKAITISARAYYPDGTVSAVAIRSYFCTRGAQERFTTAVFVLTGDPDDLTKGPDGIFYGENYHARGEESERPVYIEAIDKDGNRLFAQHAGVRIYGGASRANSIKSMKLYARKRYDPNHGKFKLDLFGTPAQDGSTVEKYDKLVLRNCGNDFQFGFIRDELCQVLAAQAGFADYEAVVPAVAYLNGKYYGFFWLHESYCDDYFKEKYPNENAQGEFIIAEGNEQHKSEEEDGGDEVYAAEYNAMYETYAYADLRNEETYAKLCGLVDIENYLDYCAFNIYINNNDWPQNNYKCYRYVPAKGEKAGTGVYDGRWRYLLHDTDFSLGMYDWEETAASYNNIQQIMDPESSRYAPLFAALMRREDCRTYFVSKLETLSKTVFSRENVTRVLYTMHIDRCTEQDYFYQHMENLRKRGDHSFWANSTHLAQNMDAIRAFAAERGEYIMSYTRNAFSIFG